MTMKHYPTSIVQKLEKTWAFSGTLALSCLILLSGCDLESRTLDRDDRNPSLGAALLSELPGEVQLIHITTDAQSNANLDFRLVVDPENQIVALRTLTQSGRRTDFPTTNLGSGIVLLRVSGQDVVKLSSKNFTPGSGGTIQMTYLNNGISGVYRNFTMELQREGSGFTVYANERTGRRKFSDMFLKKNESAFVGVIGIADVVVR